MARLPFPTSAFELPDGSPVANGYFTLRLNTDARSLTPTQLCSNSITIMLDSNGVPIGSPTFWPNGQLQPSGTYYILSVYTANGQLVSGPTRMTI